MSGSERRERAFETLYTAHYQAIAGYVLRRVSADEADDVIAQVFTVAWRRFDSVPPSPGDRLWLFGVARNSVAEQLRAGRRRLHLRARLTQEASAPLAGAADSADERVRAAMRALRPAEREALQLILWDELSHAEAATVLGCSPNAFELRYRRARNAVRDALTAKDPAAGADEIILPSHKPRTSPS